MRVWAWTVFVQGISARAGIRKIDRINAFKAQIGPLKRNPVQLRKLARDSFMIAQEFRNDPELCLQYLADWPLEMVLACNWPVS